MAGGLIKKRTWYLAAGLIICISLLFLMFGSLLGSYGKNTASGSAAHLIELNRQEKYEVETAMQSDQKLAESIGSAVSAGELRDETALFSALLRLQKNWGMEEILVYTYDGQCLNQDGQSRTNDQASQFAAKAKQNGDAFRIIKSRMEYGVAVEQKLTVRNSPVAAVSVVRNLDQLFADRKFSSFGGAGSTYLTRQNGARISSSASAGTKAVYNVAALFENGTMQSLNTDQATLEEMMNNGGEGAFLYHNAGMPAEYVILTPVEAVGDTWYLITLVPEDKVNGTMKEFSRYAILLSVAMIFLVSLIFIIYFLMYRKDTERYTVQIKTREQELREALTLANSANAAKTQFLSGVSHDIRTPLNAIINMAGFLSGDLNNKEKAQREICVIQDSSRHLLQLINDVLDMSRIESGKVTFASEPFDMAQVAKNVCEIIAPLCEAKRQTFLCETGDVRHKKVIGDALRLDQILINLLNNAVKFTPENGRIRFTITELPSLKAGTVPFRFTVEDNGIGIPAGRLKTIFDPFSRVENETVSQTEGTGLGLAIIKSYTEAQGGKITVKSTEGKGSVFTAELFYALDTGESKITEKAATTAEEIRFNGRLALLAEDNAINREIAETILRSAGFRVESAEDGRKVVEKFEASAPGTYSVVFMDIQMPFVNGYDAARAIRSSGRTDADIPIIAMTANAFSEDVERARSAGMNAHVSKPVDPAELLRVTAGVLANIHTV